MTTRSIVLLILLSVSGFNLDAQYKLYYKVHADEFRNSYEGVCKRDISVRVEVFTGSTSTLLKSRSNKMTRDCGICSCYEELNVDDNFLPSDKSSLDFAIKPTKIKAIAGLHRTGNDANEENNYDRDTSSFDYNTYKMINVNLDIIDPGQRAIYIADFLSVEESKTAPILETENNMGVVSATNATFRAPDFIVNNFTEDQIEWTFTLPTGSTHKMFGSRVNLSKIDFYCLASKVSVKALSHGWTSSELSFELRPLPDIDFIISPPLCVESQKNGVDDKAKGHIVLSDRSMNNGYYVNYYNKDNVLVKGFTFDRITPSQSLGIDGSPYKIEVQQSMGNQLFTCAKIYDNISIVAPKPIDLVQSNFIDIPCFGQKPKLAITINGNTNNYTLSYGDSAKVLSQNQTYSIPLMTQSRAYSFSITDENACVYDQALNFTATEPSKLEASMQIDSAVCYRGTTTVHLIAKGGTPYSSENPYRYGFAPSSSVQLDPILLTKGGVTIYPRVYDKNNCSVSFPVTALFNPKDFKLSVLEKFDNICPKGNVGSVLLTSQSVDKSYRYTFSKDGIGYAKDSLFQSLGAGTYTFHTQNQYGCPKDTTLQITEPPYITISKTALDSVRCFGEHNGSIQLNVTGGTGFKKLWKNKEAAYLPSNKSYSFSHTYDSLAGRNYWFHAQDSLGCLDSIAYSIGTRSHIQHRSNMISPSCNESKDGQITAYTEGGVAPYNNSWVSRPELGTSLLQKGLTKGSYILLSTDKLGCQKSDTIVLFAPPSLLVDLQGYPLICKGQSVELDAGVDGDRYLWSGSNGFSATTRKVTIDKRGTYWVEVKDYNLCVGSDTISFEQSDTEFKVDFLMATTVVQGDTVVLLNDNVSIDSMRWNLNPSNTQKLPPSLDFRAQEAIFRDLGEQDVQLMGYYKGCRDVRTRKIWVIAPQDRNKYDQAIGIKTSVIKECGLFPNPNDGSFEIHIELNEANVPVAMVLSSLATGTRIKQLDWKIYPDNKIAFQEDLPEGAYIIHIKVRDEVVALRFLVAYD